jgi:hypothetical protein
VKVYCPVCGVQGFLEVRGKSRRVIHYRGMVSGKRICKRHSIKGINGNQLMGINKPEMSILNQNKFAPIAQWSEQRFRKP